MKLGRFAAFAMFAALSGCGGDAPTTAIQAPDEPLLGATFRVQVNCPGVLYVGNSGSCWAQGYDFNNSPTSSFGYFTSNNPSSVAVTSNGVVTAYAPSGATITAWVDGVQGSAYVSVPYTPVLTSVAVTPNPASVSRYYTRQLTAKGYDQYGAQMSGLSFTWSSSNTAVATVNSSGLVYGAAVGSATITATSGGKSGSATVNVVLPSVSAGISGPSSIQRNTTYQFTGSASGGTAPYTYQWRKRYGTSSYWNGWEGWYSTGTTNSTSIYVSPCGVNRAELELRVTDSTGAVGSTSVTFYITNPC
jgi:hypothetical protein